MAHMLSATFDIKQNVKEVKLSLKMTVYQLIQHDTDVAL